MHAPPPTPPARTFIWHHPVGVCTTPRLPQPAGSQQLIERRPLNTSFFPVRPAVETGQIASVIKAISPDEKDSFRSRQLERLLAIKEKEAGNGDVGGGGGGGGGA